MRTMKSLLKAFAWLIGIPLFIALIFALFGFLAVRYNFWPPNCGVLPIPQAKRVCEFSKLDKAPSGKPAEITFWVTVPSNTPASDKVFLAILGKEPIEMKHINSTSFETTVNLTTGDALVYRYRRNSENSASDEKQYAVKSLKKTLYDAVSGWSDLDMPRISREVLPVVEMYDTWSINYNMQFFEDTRRNLDASMARIQEMGGKQIGVYSFIEILGDKEDIVVQEDPPMPRNIFGQLKHKYGRDASITESEMKQIAKTADKYGLETILFYNVGADYTKYIQITANPFARRGTGGDVAEKRAGEDFGRYDPKTTEWLDSYFGQLQVVLVDWARRAETAGIGAIDITPRYRPPTTAPFDDYADEKWRGIVSAMREVYRGKIYADGNPTYRDAVDGLIVNTGITVRPDATIVDMREAWKRELRAVEAAYAGYNKPLFVMAGLASFDGALSGKSGMEFLDYLEVEAAGYERDWQEQADGYEAFFQALSEGNMKFAGIGTRFLSWDDMMGPDYIPSRYSDLASNIRNKPAEAVWKKWVLSAE